MSDIDKDSGDEWSEEELHALFTSIQAPYKDYNECLGAFIVEFSATEKILVDVLKASAEMQNDIGHAVLGGVRVHDGMSMLNRVLEAGDLSDKKAEIKRALDHLGEINTTRNNIIHWGAERVGTDEFLVTNRHLVHRRQVPVEYTVTPADLKAMTADLGRIQLHLVCLSDEADENSYFSKHAPSIQEMLREPWQYKPPQRAAPKKRSPDKPPKPPRPPRPSRA